MDETPICPADDPRLEGLRRILAVMDRLRGEGGCPWDRAQTPHTLRGYLLEETYELLEALDEEDAQGVREELGDVLFQVVFHARIAEELDEPYHLGDVATGIARKLHRRHPHVFAEPGRLEHPEQVLTEWEQLKRQEGRKSVLEGVPRALPALLRAQRVQEKASRVGFDWTDVSGPLEKLDEELAEVKEALANGSRDEVAAELGDLAFSLVNLARHLDVNLEDALRESTAKFERRFRHVERQQPDLRGLDLEALEALWQAAKRALEP